MMAFNFVEPQEKYCIVELWNAGERKSTLQVPLRTLDSSSVSLIAILDHFKRQGADLLGKKVYYTSPINGTEVYCGQNPFLDIFTLPFTDIKFLKLRIEDTPMEEDNSSEISQNDTPTLPAVAFNREKLTVRGVINKVNTWKKLVTVGSIENTIATPLTNEEAARRVKFTTKHIKNSIYLIKTGRKYGYKFAANMDKSIRDLVDYITLMKKRVNNKTNKTTTSPKMGSQNGACFKCGGCRQLAVPNKFMAAAPKRTLPSLKWKPVLPTCPEL
eukprot:CAMPEP_0114971922 /NCGR_PEP_ID=MMETSP0216-20121206/110_1 /TAXON_ID=223996 /ORGANISM="Protocruzia adherens, Strain Boccale" /LENGTH=271 /DNA_ID=CAMNT_0002332241 /DNA_START=1702 /DNA_END=2517 /DNA_ORIENTATION=-